MTMLKPTLLALGALLAGLSPAKADTLWWDVNGTDPGASVGGSATGTWSATDANWTTDPDGLATPGLYVSGSDVVFSAGADTDATGSTITLSGDQSAGSVTFEEGKYSFSGGRLVLGDGTLTIGSGVSVTQGSTTVEIAGAQVWTNSGGSYSANSNGFSVAAGIAAPSLTFAGGNFGIRGGLTDSSGGGAFSLTIQDGSSVTYNNTAANTYTGGTFIKAGTLRVTQTANGIGPGTLTLGDTAGSASAFFNPVNGGTVANDITVLAGGSSFIGIGGSGNTQTYTGAVTLNGTLTLTTTAGSGSTPTFVMSGLITGTGGLAMKRNGSNLNNLNVTLNGDNTYGGGTTVNYGTLRINNGGASAASSAIGTGALTINAGSIDNTSGGDVTLKTNNAVVLNNNLTFGGTNNLNLGTGAVSLGTASGAGRTVTTNGSATLTLGGVISDGSTAKNLTKAGAGTLVLSGDSTYTGTTTVSAGRLFVNGHHAGSGAITVNSGATLGGSGSLSGAATAAAGSFLAPGADGMAGTLTFNGALDLSGLAGGDGGLLFDLGSAGASDSISAGALTLGSGLLDLDDFSFTTLDGYGAGVYTLLSFTSVVGTLGSNLTGTVGGLGGTLSLSGNDLVLTVSAVPEPSAFAFLAGSVALLVVGLRRRRA